MGKPMNVHFCCRSVAALIILGVLPPTTLAQDAPDPHHDHDLIHGASHEHDVLEEVVVTATPLDRNLIEMSQSSTVLKGSALQQELHNNIGETLTRLPGLSNASFGQNVGRPVIRGLQGVRVGVLNDNMTSSDASAVSQDHAVPVEPFLADQIEVLRGPATLIYGSGSIGGVINVVSNTIPVALPENQLEGRVLVQGDSAANQKFAVGRLDFGSGSFAGHVSAFYRRTEDYEIPGPAELYPEDDLEDHEEEQEGEEHQEGSTGILENSFLDNEGGAIGASWIGETWTVGLSYTAFDSDYGIPGAHAHEHEDEHEGSDEHELEDEEENVTVGLENRRIDGLLLGVNPIRGFERFKLNVAQTDYQHTEFEGEEIGTVFDSETLDARLELRHVTMGRWSGAFGGQVMEREFSAIGEEAFVPPSDTDSWALFWVESAEFENWRLDLGLRYENVDTSALELDHEHKQKEEVHHEDEGLEIISRDFTPMSFSTAAVWHVNDNSHLAFTFASAERAPSDAELFSFGPHLATQTFEVGNPDLGVETNRHYEVSWRLHEGALTGAITFYYDDFDDYIYQADTGLVEDGLPLRQWSQQGANFTGGELEINWDIGHTLSGHWQLFGFYDRVEAELSDGSSVPRIPPQRFGLGADWDHRSWAGNMTWIRADDHTDTAEYETATPGYDLLNAEISYRFGFDSGAGMELYLKGQNLLNEDIRNSTSFLKDQAPQIGRNFILGARLSF
jgi:iron complex outermembrane receptor protein